MSKYGSAVLGAAADVLVNDGSDDGIFQSAILSNSGANPAWVIFLNTATEAAAADLKGILVPAGEIVPVPSNAGLPKFIRAFSTAGTTLSWHLLGQNF